MDINEYENLSDEELLNKMAELDWDIVQKEQELKTLQDILSQAQQAAIRQERFTAVRQAQVARRR